MQRYFAEISYDGTNYHGWQFQPNAPTVQEEINKAIAKILNLPEVKTMGCGRTDAGVHASQFFLHFDIENEVDTKRLTFVLNKILDPAIVVKRIFEVAPKSHSRFSATSRRYHYYFGKERNPFDRHFVNYNLKELNVQLMQQACAILFEYKDFTSFSKAQTQTATNDCTIMDAQWIEKEHQLIFTIKANRFLRNMVRAIVGTMLDVGLENISLDDFRKIIELKNRDAAGKSVSGHALFLSEVNYPDGLIPQV
jgi:tRNA pseudouridine38-40 synthase